MTEALWRYALVAAALSAWGVLIVALWRRRLRRLRAAHRADWGRAWINELDGLNRWFCRRYHRLRHNRLDLPARGPAIVAANHVSGLDPLLLVAASRRPLRFIIAREQYRRAWLTWLFRAIGCIPVDRSTNPRRALAAARAALARGEVVALFPQGRIHLDHEPPARLKAGVHYLAQATGAPIFPVRIDGVRGAGRVVSAVLRRSRARLRCHPPIDAAGRPADAVLAELGERLRGRR
ncbi:MAG TPA: lysophospholipid acyltransferase family protein [Acidiferrobacterales bacterium]